MKVDVIIPVYGPGNRLLELFDRLGRQTVPVDRLIIMNTEKYLWDKWTETLEPGRLPENLSVYHVTKEEFDHGATRDAGIGHSDADVCVCMTHDALPADTNLIKALTDALFSGDDIAVAYARQLPATDCNIIEILTIRTKAGSRDFQTSTPWGSRPTSVPMSARHISGRSIGNSVVLSGRRSSTRT